MNVMKAGNARSVHFVFHLQGNPKLTEIRKVKIQPWMSMNEAAGNAFSAVQNCTAKLVAVIGHHDGRLSAKKANEIIAMRQNGEEIKPDPHFVINLIIRVIGNKKNWRSGINPVDLSDALCDAGGIKKTPIRSERDIRIIVDFLAGRRKIEILNKGLEGLKKHEERVAHEFTLPDSGILIRYVVGILGNGHCFDELHAVMGRKKVQLYPAEYVSF